MRWLFLNLIHFYQRFISPLTPPSCIYTPSCSQYAYLAIELAGGPGARISVIPAAAAPDHNHERAGRNAELWFRGLGAREVAALPLIDRESADHPAIAAALRDSRLIYMLGGFTHYLGR